MHSTRGNLNLSITAHNHNSGPRQPRCSSAGPRLLFVPNAALHKRTRPHMSTDGPDAAEGEEGEEKDEEEEEEEEVALTHV